MVRGAGPHEIPRELGVLPKAQGHVGGAVDPTREVQACSLPNTVETRTVHLCTACKISVFGGAFSDIVRALQ